MKIAFSLFLVTAVHSFSVAQEGNWDTYIARYENGPGSTTLNMDLVKGAPIKALPFVVITGVTYKKCNSDGFPLKDEFENLYKISDEVNQAVSSLTQSELAGTFTNKCERLDYIYVHDTVGIRVKLTRLYHEKFPAYQPYMNIRPDKEWTAYLSFLYPNEETQEYMANQKVVMKLMSAGDKLSKPRVIDHWLYFKNKISRDSFIKYAEGKGFKVVDAEYIKDSEFGYQLHLSKIGNVKLGDLSNLTLELRKKARELNGEYDGWESVVVKE